MKTDVKAIPCCDCWVTVGVTIFRNFGRNPAFTASSPSAGIANGHSETRDGPHGDPLETPQDRDLLPQPADFAAAPDGVRGPRPLEGVATFSKVGAALRAMRQARRPRERPCANSRSECAERPGQSRHTRVARGSRSAVANEGGRGQTYRPACRGLHVGPRESSTPSEPPQCSPRSSPTL
jgi:hypothetical protein